MPESADRGCQEPLFASMSFAAAVPGMNSQDLLDFEGAARIRSACSRARRA